MVREGARFKIFTSTSSRNKFEDCKHLDFIKERSFSLEEHLIEGIKEAHEKRNWLKRNGLEKECNHSLAIEF